MYAVIKTGGKQYTVAEGDLIKVEKLPGEVGSKVELREVLAVGEGENVEVGAPLVANAKVVCKIQEQGRDKKIIVFKKKKRKGYKKKQGHRQSFTALQIDVISK